MPNQSRSDTIKKIVVLYDSGDEIAKALTDSGRYIIDHHRSLGDQIRFGDVFILGYFDQESGNKWTDCVIQIFLTFPEEPIVVLDRTGERSVESGTGALFHRHPSTDLRMEELMHLIDSLP